MAEAGRSHRAQESPVRTLHTASKDHAVLDFPPARPAKVPVRRREPFLSGHRQGLAWGHRTHKGWCRRVCSLPQYF